MKNALMSLCVTLILLIDNLVFGQATALPAWFGPHQWTAKVKVIGEDGNPIFGADVAVSYDIPSPSGQSGKGMNWDQVEGLTDSNGMFRASHTDSSQGLAITVEKSGYYTTHAGHQFYYDEKRRNPTFTLVLKSIGKPIPMYAKWVDSEPRAFKKTGRPPIVFKKSIGYDLMVGDWVAPCGKGQTTDIIFTEDFNKQSFKDINYKLTISFANTGDGIQTFDVPALLQNATMGQSDLTSSHEAPVDGYQPEYVQTKGQDLNQNYYFRVRTVLDSNGNIKSALYGKIYGDFMQFRYYLNPTPNSRNVEFDPKQNLLGGLNSLEEVSAP